MVAQAPKVIPPARLDSAGSAAMVTEQAAAPHPGVVPIASPGSPADDAVATIAAGMSGRSAQLSAKLAGKGPRVQATTQAGVARLQARDQQNAAQIGQLADGVRDTRPTISGAQRAATAGLGSLMFAESPAAPLHRRSGAVHAV